MKALFLTIILLTFSTVLFSQTPSQNVDSRPLNNINVSILSDASFGSINYERQFFIKPTFFMSGKLGLGQNKEVVFCLLGPCPTPEKFVTVPHHITANVGKGRHFFEYGLGGTILAGNTTQQYVLYPMVGYRFWPLKENNLNFRVTFQYPFADEHVSILFIPYGLSLGFCF